MRKFIPLILLAASIAPGAFTQQPAQPTQPPAEATQPQAQDAQQPAQAEQPQAQAAAPKKQKKAAPPPPRRPMQAAHLSTVAMIDLPGRPGFSDIAFANNLLVVSQTNANTIDIFDPQKRRLVAQVTNIAEPRGIAVDARGNRFYVATANSVITVISSQDWQVKDTFAVQGSPDVLALSPDGLRLYVGDKQNSTVSAVDTSLRRTIGTTQLDGRPECIAAGDGNMVWVSVQDSATVVGIDAQLKIAAQYKVNGSQPAGLVYDANLHRIYVAVRSAVVALDADHGSEVARVTAAQGVEDLTLDAAGHTLFAAGGGSILSMNTAGGLKEVDELLADVKGHNIVFDPSRKLLFLPGGREGRSKMLIVKDLSQAGTQTQPETDAALH